MLSRNHDRGRADRFALGVTQRHLTFGIRQQFRCNAGMAGFGHGLQNTVGKMDRGRHQAFGFGAGVTEHDALITGAFVLVAGCIDAHGDVT